MRQTSHGVGSCISSQIWGSGRVQCWCTGSIDLAKVSSLPFLSMGRAKEASHRDGGDEGWFVGSVDCKFSG